MRRLSGWDAYMLYSETATIHNHTLKVAVVDVDANGRSLTVGRLRRALTASLPALDPLRFRLVEVTAGLHHPMWRERCPVELDRHVFELTASLPGDMRTLDDIVGEIASIPLDRRIPLWTVHVVSGLAEGKVALVAKVHHALADGVASANLLAVAVGSGSHASIPISGAPADPEPTRSEVFRAALRDHVSTARRLPRVVARTLAAIARARRFALEIPEEDVRAFRAPVTILNGAVGPQRAFATQTLHLPTVKDISKELGITINDVVLALSSGALRDYFLQHGQPTVPLLAAVPVSTDRDVRRICGNEMAGLLTSLPLDESDPIDRCRRVHQTTSIAKRNLEIWGKDLISSWLEYLPPWTSMRLFAALSSSPAKGNRVFNLPLSNVPGPRKPVQIAGHPMVGFFSVGPLYSRSGINITVWSYVDQLNVSVLTDPLIVAEPESIADGMARGLADLVTELEQKHQA